MQKHVITATLWDRILQKKTRIVFVIFCPPKTVAPTLVQTTMAESPHRKSSSQRTFLDRRHVILMYLGSASTIFYMQEEYPVANHFFPCPMKLFSFSYPEGDAGRKQRGDSLLSPSPSNDLHVSDTTNKHNKQTQQTDTTNKTNRHNKQTNTITNTNVKRHTHAHAHAHAHAHVHAHVMYMRVKCRCACTCRRQSYCAKKHETIVQSHSLRTANIYIYIYSSQHRTAQRMTARRSVIHASSYPSSVLVTVRAKNKY